MNAPYRHRQPGWFMLISLAATVVFIVVLAALLGAAPMGLAVSFAFAGGLVAIMALLFSSLTVEVSERELSWYFGPRFWRNRLALTEIEKAAPIKSINMAIPR